MCTPRNNAMNFINTSKSLSADILKFEKWVISPRGKYFFIKKKHKSWPNGMLRTQSEQLHAILRNTKCLDGTQSFPMISQIAFKFHSNLCLSELCDFVASIFIQVLLYLYLIFELMYETYVRKNSKKTPHQFHFDYQFMKRTKSSGCQRTQKYLRAQKFFLNNLMQ